MHILPGNTYWTTSVQSIGFKEPPVACGSVASGLLIRPGFKLQVSHSLEISVGANNTANYKRALKKNPPSIFFCLITKILPGLNLCSRHGALLFNLRIKKCLDFCKIISIESLSP